MVVPPALREEREQPEQDGEYAARGGRHHVYRTALEVVALDAVTGRQYWKLRGRSIPRSTTTRTRSTRPGDRRQRPVLGDGRLPLIAIDATSGLVLWNKVLADYKKGYQYNVPPLVIRDKVILGPATNEMGANCWLSAYAIKDGKELWRFDTAPTRADSPEAETWVGDSWKHAGNPIWNAGSYDAETNLTFWGIGNPNPGWNGDSRTPADNLYSASVIALDADTGKLKWFYQFTPGDEYDWDATQVPVLADLTWQGRPRKLMLWANRNGFFYVLDRVTGQFLLGKPFVKQTWAFEIDKNGRPVKTPRLAQADGRHLVTRHAGGHQLVPAFIQPAHGLFYVTTWDNYSGRSGKYDPARGRSACATPDRRRPRTPSRPAVAEGGARPLPTRRKKRDTAPSARSTRTPARRSGISRWSTSARAVFCRPDPISCSPAGARAASSRSTRKRASSSGTSILAVRAPAAPSATPSAANSTLSARAQARCSCSRCPTDLVACIRHL